jgi:flagellar P-ring protein FlgI
VKLLRSILAGFLCGLLLLPSAVAAGPVRLKELGRIDGWRDNALIGYGIVTGLAGSGDSPRSGVTRQALKNALSRLGVNVAADDLQSRNVAAVIVTATLPPSARVGDRIDITVTSIGDARSLAGGTLLLTPLVGPDQRSYALAQGSLVVGGFRFDADGNLSQKNYPTTGLLPNGATVETAVSAGIDPAAPTLTYLLKTPDYSTATRTADAINLRLGRPVATVQSAEAILIDTRGAGAVGRLIATLEDVTIIPDGVARVVVNERSGTVVAGSGVQLSDVVIAQGDLKISVTLDNRPSQPGIYGSYFTNSRGLIVSNTRLEASEGRDAVVRFPGTSVGDLVQALSRARVNTRTMISILQAMKAAGALHAEIIVQ